ncbi:hypothetical protein BD309DRAFT_1083290 [Dichomitus squalens]|uniref:Uncharacterized protein n=1 Tax=Dichomitus squalens TaxID=114155 RepID=A0A4Q9PRJ2_9APHY|nr:hypothetical protein BD309DRAFT_1083290 [Dichomitus squalens]TBU56999.1 hypothetical protein BD310DRAFT_881703 [Dichomitus squalens]
MSRQVGGQDQRTFAGTLLRDGTSYFLTLLILNVLHIIFTSTSVAESGLGTQSVIPRLEEPLTSILTARFLINLQKVHRKLAASSRSLSQMSDVAFQPHVAENIHGFVGSLGSQLSFGEDDVEDDMVGDDIDQS